VKTTNNWNFRLRGLLVYVDVSYAVVFRVQVLPAWGEFLMVMIVLVIVAALRLLIERMHPLVVMIVFEQHRAVFLKYIAMHG